MKNYIQKGSGVCIITGASSGLGSVFAEKIDQDPEISEIWLIARRKKNMEAVSRKLKKKSVILQIDLSQTDGISPILKKLQKENPEIKVLVNNAGFGCVGTVQQLDRVKQVGMVDVNIRALTELTLVCLPYMKHGGRIINLASSAGFAPMANFSIYSASKAYVINFSYSLAAELQESGISVTCVCPGPVKTEFFKNASGNDAPLMAVSPESVVNKALLDSKKGKIMSVYGFPIILYRFLAPILPNILITWFTKKVRFV